MIVSGLYKSSQLIMVILAVVVGNSTANYHVVDWYAHDIVSTWLYTDPNGFRKFYMDSVDDAQHKMLACETLWFFKKGWNEWIMNLTKALETV